MPRVKRGDFETVQVNGRIAVLTLPLLRRVDLDVPDVELRPRIPLGTSLGMLGRAATAGR